MEASQRRLAVVAGHFDTSHKPRSGAGAGGGASSPPPLDVAALQHLLDHDNHEMRARAKELLREDVFIPCAAPPAPAARSPHASPAFFSGVGRLRHITAARPCRHPLRATTHAPKHTTHPTPLNLHPQSL